MYPSSKGAFTSRIHDVLDGDERSTGLAPKDPGLAPRTERHVIRSSRLPSMVRQVELVEHRSLSLSLPPSRHEPSTRPFSLPPTNPLFCAVHVCHVRWVCSSAHPSAH
jgi:hypothetical protein